MSTYKHSKLIQMEETEDRTLSLMTGYLRNLEPKRIDRPIPRLVVHLIESFYHVSDKWINLESKLNARYPCAINDDIDNIGCIQGCKMTQHYKSCILTLLMLSLPISYIICWIISSLFSNNCSSLCYIIYCVEPYWLIAFAVLYLSYLFECVCMGSSTLMYLLNASNLDGFNAFIGSLTNTAPKLWCTVDVGHYEEIDVEGSSMMKWWSTFRGTRDLELKSWKDISTDVNTLQLEKYKFVKINVHDRVLLSDEMSALTCNQRMESFKNTHKHKDEECYIYPRWSINAEGVNQYTRQFLYKRDNDGFVSKMISAKYYVLLSVLGCSVCYRIWFSSVCGRRRYTMVKEVEL